VGSPSRRGPGIPESTFELPKRSERATGIEPAFSAWEADVLPLYDARWGNAPLGPNVSRASPELSGAADRHAQTRRDHAKWRKSCVKSVKELFVASLKPFAPGVTQNRGGHLASAP
jgi:hypothetical protein